MNTKQLISIFIISITILSLTACQSNQIDKSGITNGNDYTTLSTNKKIETQTFHTDSDYKRFLKETTNSQYFYDMYYSDVFMRDIAVPTSVLAEATNMAKTGSGTTLKNVDFSKTNNQVLGVDEGDILKTDGNYIYTITDKTVYIVRAYPGEDAEVKSTIKTKNRPLGLFISKNKLAVFGDVEDNKILEEAEIRIRNGMSYIEIYDISDKKNPELEKTYRFEGRYFNSRMIGNEAYLMTSFYPEFRQINPLPIVMEENNVVPMKPTDIHYFDIHYQNPNFVGIHAINLWNDKRDSSKIVAVEGQPNMYMSENNIFITYDEWIDEYDIRQQIFQEILEPDIPAYYKTIIAKIKNADIDVLNPSEKKQKIMSLYNEYFSGLSSKEQEDMNALVEKKYAEKINEMKYLEYTIINKISVNDGHINIDANGKVPGSLVNQFSMDEYDDVFRIATTVRQRWLPQIELETKESSNEAVKKIMPRKPTESTNNVYTLDKNLNTIGMLEGLAKGERIYSTRFIEDRLYMVTFRQVDPFFVIDLSNPEKPMSLGELKIPGFSRYLHPYDKDTIIGIGRDATEIGRQQGLKISLFDVSDVSNPVEIAKYVSDQKYSSSTAEYEHKAFLFDKEKELLVIPAYNYNYQDKSENYNGAMVFKIKKDDIELRGLIDHSKYVDSNDYRYRYGSAVERSLFIEDLLYTKSPAMIRINRLDDLSSVKNVGLEKTSNGHMPIY